MVRAFLLCFKFRDLYLLSNIVQIAFNLRLVWRFSMKFYSFMIYSTIGDGSLILDFHYNLLDLIIFFW